jgi:primosomal protein N' (replication factor Y) (superfamily II helicase)
MTLYAEIAIHAAVPTTFHYIVPDWLEEDIQVGHLVNVSVRNSRQPGVVMRLGRERPPIPELKPVNGLLDPMPVLSPAAVDLAFRLADEYLAPVGLCAWLWLPPNVQHYTDQQVRLLDRRYEPADAVEGHVLALLGTRGTQRFSQLRASMRQDRWLDAVEALAAQGVVEIETILTPPQPKPKRIQTARALFHPTMLSDAVEAVPARLKRADTLGHVLRVLSRESGPVDVSWVYAQTGATVADLKRLDELDLIEVGEKRTWHDALMERDYVPAHPPHLTDQQVRAWAHIEQAAARDAYAAFLLHGVTGSGKTEVYLRAIDVTLKQGRQCLYLVPEIALTAQTIRRVQARFPGRAAVVHSRLSEAERYRVWQRARAGEIDIVVGPRSALFMPLPDAGLVVIDEEHDGSYRGMSAPVYDTRALAEWWMRANDGLLLLGSATPDMETLLRAQTKDLTLLELPKRVYSHRMRVETQAARARVVPQNDDVYEDALARGLPPVTLVDMRDELKAGNTTIFSRALTDALGQTLERDEQALLYLNRRGTSTYVFCRDCGYAARCPNCDQPLTYHDHDSKLRCHTCGHVAPNPIRCPQCQSDRIRYFGAGTQHVEAEVARRFPSARVIRWDSDVVGKPEIHDALLSRFLDHQADIIVGTTMVTKGLDLPLVTLVGVVSADVALNMPDFHNAERGFQLITQAIGRAGRGLKPGQAIVQSHTPEHYAVAHAARHDYHGFARRELEYRQSLGYPPFRRMARVVFRHQHAARCRDMAEQAARALRLRISELGLSGTDLIGPAPCFFQRVANEYRWQVIVRAPDPRVLLREVAAANGWHVEMDPDEVL